MEYFQYFGLFPFFVLLKLGEAYYYILVNKTTLA